MKTKEELNELKIEYESLSRKLAELTDKELEQVTGGVTIIKQNLVVRRAQQQLYKNYDKTGNAINTTLNDIFSDYDNND